jgi:two-component system, response regulator RegA
VTGRPTLLVEDDPTFAEVLAGALRRRGFDVAVALTCAEARQRIAERRPEFAVLDLRLGAESGLSLLPELAGSPRPARTVVLTGYGSIATAVEAIKLGATQYLTKPVEVDTIVTALTGPELADSRAVPAAGPPIRPLTVKRLEWEHIQRVLADNRGNVSATARALGIHRRTLQRKLHKRPVST